MTPPTSAVVLVVDDDAEVRHALTTALAQGGYEVAEAADGRQGLAQFRSRHPALVVTDLAMPVADGFELIRGVREEGETPVLVLSVRGGEEDKVAALDLGADDYVVKPFSVAELLARVRAQLRRPRGSGSSGPPVLTFPDLEIDSERHLVRQGGRDVKLTPIEFGILEILARNVGKPVTISALIRAVWHDAPGTSPDTVRVHVSTLRKKIEPEPARPRYIVTEPWVGYRFLPEPLAGS